VVVGDTLLDIDLRGHSARLSPEAPVPVIDVAERCHRPGGAGLAAWLAAAAGADVVLVTALGDDDDGRALSRLLRRQLEVVALPLAGRTVSKTRVFTAGAPTARLDSGSGQAGGPVPADAVAALAGAGTVLVSDYGRGATALPELRAALAAASRRVPVVWDPHPRGSTPTAGAALITPNESEAEAALASSSSGASSRGRVPTSRADERGQALRDRWRADAVAVTVGARGALVTGADGVTISVPVPQESAGGPAAPVDTCGAGDQFAAATALALAGGASTVAAVRSGVAAAAGYVAAGAAAAVSRPVLDLPTGLDPYALADQVRRTGGTVVATGGCFDLLHRGHVNLLGQARALGDALVVCLNSDASVRRAKGASRPLVDQHDRAEMLRALAAVDGVLIFDEDTPAAVLDRLRPDVWVKGADYQGVDLAEAEVVRRHGGRVVLAPTVPGYSTTRLVSTLSATARRQEIA
jgi:rfaE bifunctional protein nucleotidyltransferase chain/domain/rfaE bifunctional protein kinase chain/domain